MVYLFLANGFEITEAMAPLDVMRRAGMDVKTVGVTGEYVESSNGVTVKADAANGIAFTGENEDGSLQFTVNGVAFTLSGLTAGAVK